MTDQDYDTPLCVHCSDPLDSDGRDLITGETFCGANPSSDKHELPSTERWISPELNVGGMPGHYDFDHGNDHPHCPGCREMRQARKDLS